MSADAPGRRRGAAENPDRTERAVRQHLAAMACGLYELGVYPVGEGVKYNRERDADGILALLAWLKAKNANGHHVYIRPHESSGLVLVDDVTWDALRRMTSYGLAPAAVIETSPQSYQAWIRLSLTPLPGPLDTRCHAALARLYGGDPDAAHRRQFGRLAGFTNRKPERRLPDGRYPFVRFVLGNRGLPRMATAFVKRVAAMTYEPWQPRPHRTVLSAARSAAPECLAQQYGQMMAERRARYPDADLHRHDMAVCRALAQRHAGLTEAELAQAIRDASPDLEQRHAGEVDSYCRRTAHKAIAGTAAE